MYSRCRRIDFSARRFRPRVSARVFRRPAGNRRHSGVTPRERPCRAASWTPGKTLSPAGTSCTARAPFEHGAPFAGAGRAPFLSPLKCSLHRRCKRHFGAYFTWFFPTILRPNGAGNSSLESGSHPGTSRDLPDLPGIRVFSGPPPPPDSPADFYRAKRVRVFRLFSGAFEGADTMRDARDMQKLPAFPVPVSVPDFRGERSRRAQSAAASARCSSQSAGSG